MCLVLPDVPPRAPLSRAAVPRYITPVKAFLLGANGQLGHELAGVLSCFAHVSPATEADFDMTDAAALRRAIDAAAPDVIINAAAFTDVDGAEKHPMSAARVNAEAVGVLGDEARIRRCALIHYSTDFVFDGTKAAPYVETDDPCPVNEYGRSKLAGENALLQADAPAIVFRTAWVYGLRCKSFVSTILRLARERTTLRIVNDQVGNPTFCRDLAEATAVVLFGMRAAPFERVRELRGIYHLAGAGACSRFELAREVVALDPARAEQVLQSLEPIATSAYPLPARRPAHAVLDCSKARNELGIALPPWRSSLARALAG